MNFEWDPKKAAANAAKHGVRFEVAKHMFENRALQWLDVRWNYGEDRWVGLAEIDARLYAVVWTNPCENTVRLISARKANEREIRRFRRETRSTQAEGGPDDTR